ncbi:MAG TPA: Stk1 family PASTA domain-containing Ser/Thr kinase [Aeromicrobium sp.]|nr:Stk1 family PASTA domain-containing Ser/Thr kinase [Aeromicrobium sp.]
MAPPGDDALVGRVLNGRYLIDQRIARGGMATVYRATDQRLARTVAIKVMHRNMGDEVDFLERFNREAKAAARLNHRGVVSVYDQGNDLDATYLVMEYIPGHTLRDAMRAEAPMTPDRSLGILADILVALAAAHAAGIIHRDIKPENVLITPDGDVKVADFGLARAVSTATTAPGGALIGTVSYIAPEIVLNERADARSDVYACGAMLYEMLTAAKPHGGDTPIQVAYKHVHEDVGAPSTVQPGIPDYVDALVARATARDRNQRPADARVLLQMVRRVQRAMDQGLEHDAALAAQLKPSEGATMADDNDSGQRSDVGPLGLSADEPTTQVNPMFAPSGARAEDSIDTDIVSTEPPSEPTVAWTTGAPPPPRGVVPPMSVQHYRADRESLDNSKRGLYILLAVLGLALVIAGISWYYGIARYESAPRLVGMSETNALAEAEAAGFEFKIANRAFSETAPLGTVMKTDPEPGNRVLPGALIRGTVSKGPERHPVPDLEGKTTSEAMQALRKERLKVGNVTRDWSQTIAKGHVSKLTGVKVGDRLRRNARVSFVVSKGREPIQVVNTAGQTRGGAFYTLQNRGFAVAVRQAYSDRVTEGRVISQYPSSGTMYRGDTITITVSLGPERVKVPGVVGSSCDEGDDELSDAGFDVSRNGGDGRIIGQNPSGGDKAKVGSTVTIACANLPPGHQNDNSD